SARGDLNFHAGEDTLFGMDDYFVDAHTDAFAGAVIPISSVDAHGYVVQTNKITVGTGAQLYTAGDANLLTNSVGLASVTAHAKASSWLSDAGDAILSATGGNVANSYKGTAFSVSHGIVEVNGAIHTGSVKENGVVLTGIGRNIDATFDYDSQGNIISDNPSIIYATGTQERGSTLFDQYNKIQQELAKYKAIQATLQTPSDTVNATIAFDQQQLTAIENQLRAQGLGAQQPDGTFAPTTKQ